MAKKKPTAAAKTEPAARKKAPRRKTATTKKTSVKTAGSKTTKSRKSAASSVDGILKTFERERVAHNSTLASTRKKIEQLTSQMASIKSDLEDLKKKAVETEIAIETLDSRRDAEVGSLLSGMGIDLAKAAAAAKPKPSVEKSTPLFDGPDKPEANPETEAV